MVGQSKEKLYSYRITAGERTYTFDVVQSRDGTRSLVIGEVRGVTEVCGEHSHITVLQEHFSIFISGLEKALRSARKPSKAKAYDVEEIRREYPKAYRPWTTDEENRLRTLYLRGITVEDLATTFQRAPGAIRSRLSKLGLLEQDSTPPLQLNPVRIVGNWAAGWALDVHTVSSVPLADGSFDTKRTELGEHLYQLKYCFDASATDPIAEAVAHFLKTRSLLKSITAIIPVPPSNMDRPFQPVQELATRIGQNVGLTVPLGYLRKVKSTDALKAVDDPRSRKEQLRGAFKVADRRLEGKGVLVLDDLFRSGETLKEITDVLLREGNVSQVYVLTITKTRTKR